jgi:dolichyl-phosphate-mannose-protein mannosyltransferase
MLLNKKDIITIVALSVIFFSIASWNLGLVQAPTTTVKFSEGQSFYIDIGTQTNVGSLYFLLQDGAYNVTIYSGSLGNWSLVRSGETFSDYYKWKETKIDQTTQYIRVDFGKPESPYYAIISELAVSNLSNQQIFLANITSLESTNANLHNLIDEQNTVQLPFTYMSQTYFDEIYFVRTAEQYLHLQSPYEWTHPPLGKLIQAAGITMFGFSPFGWRLIGVIFGTLMIPVMYLLGKRLFGTWIGAFASAFLLTFDFMHFTMARMGTADTYVVFFSILTQLFLFIYISNVVKKGWNTSVAPLFFAVIFFILGFSTKWLVLYGAVGMLSLLVVLRLRDVSKLKTNFASKYAAFFDHPFLLLLGFIGVAVGIYFLIYIPDMLTGRPFFGTNGVIDLQFAMYNYHANLVATHSFASPWWSWPLMISFKGYVPLWLNVTYLQNSIDSTISVLGNPAIWWVGFVFMIVLTERAIRGKELIIGLKNKLKKKPTNEALIETTPIDLAAASALVTEQTAPATPQTPDPENVELLKQNPSRKWDIAAIFIVVVFFSSWIPYIFISRVTFIYHFYVSVPFLCLASAYFINKYWNTRRGKIATIIFFASVIVLFVVFYPVISGAPVSTTWIHKLKWFPSWFFAP